MKETKAKKVTKKTVKAAPKAKVAKKEKVVEKKEEVCACESTNECKCTCECGCKCGCDCGCTCKCCKKRMLDYYLDVLSDYIRFDGRLSRRGYWSFVWMNFWFGLLCLIGDIFFHTYGIIFLTYGLLTVVPSYAAIARRLHDTNHSMLWGMFPLLIAPIALKAVEYLGAKFMANCAICYNVLMVFVFITLVLSFIMMFYLLRKGCDGTNKYGEKPCC